MIEKESLSLSFLMCICIHIYASYFYNIYIPMCIYICIYVLAVYMSASITFVTACFSHLGSQYMSASSLASAMKRTLEADEEAEHQKTFEKLAKLVAMQKEVISLVEDEENSGEMTPREDEEDSTLKAIPPEKWTAQAVKANQEIASEQDPSCSKQTAKRSSPCIAPTKEAWAKYMGENRYSATASST